MVTVTAEEKIPCRHAQQGVSAHRTPAQPSTAMTNILHWAAAFFVKVVSRLCAGGLAGVIIASTSKSAIHFLSVLFYLCNLRVQTSSQPLRRQQHVTPAAVTLPRTAALLDQCKVALTLFLCHCDRNRTLTVGCLSRS